MSVDTLQQSTDQEWENYWTDVKASPLEQWIQKYKSSRGYNKFAKVVSQYWKDGNCIEIGSGLAYVSRILGKERSNIYALDYNFNVCRQAQEIVNREGKDVDFIQGDIFKLPFSDNSFDVLNSTGLLEHFEKDDLKIIIGEMKRVSRVVIANLPQKHFSWEPFWSFRRKLGSRIDPDQRLFEPKEMEELFSELGFGEINVKTLHFGGMFPYMSLVAI